MPSLSPLKRCTWNISEKIREKEFNFQMLIIIFILKKVLGRIVLTKETFKELLLEVRSEEQK